MKRFIGNPLTLGSLGGGRQSVAMTPAERARHLYVVGATRTGKSKLLEDCIRQDLLAWPRSGCGMLVLDRHGSLNDGVLKWAAACDLANWPIVPIDLRRSDWTVSYNPLRRRGAEQEQSVIVGNFVRSILHAWGQSDSNATPRLAKWLEMTLYTLHTNDLTLAEALHLLVNPPTRRALVNSIEDSIFRSVWDSAPVKESEFQEMVESTVNRVRKFLSRQVMRAALGQNDVSLDLSAAIEDGQIILATIATEAGKIDEEDANTFGSLLLSDLWMAAKARGKRDEGGVKPFYLYLDEFQEYVTPSMAETLDQASGFGLHATLAHQFPSQLLKSDQGRQLYNSVLANCRSKVIFQLEHNQDVEELATMVYRPMVDLMKVKEKLYSTKVLRHELKYLESYGSGTSQSTGGGTSLGHTDGMSRTHGSTWSHTDSVSESISETDGISESSGIGLSLSDSLTQGSNKSESIGESIGRSESHDQGTSWGESQDQSSGETTSAGSSWGTSREISSGTSLASGTSRSQSVALGRPTADMQTELAEYWNGGLGADDEARFKSDRGEHVAITEGESANNVSSSGTSLSDSTGGSSSRAVSLGRSASWSHGGSDSHSAGVTHSQSLVNASGTSLARSHGSGLSASEEFGISHSTSVSQGTSSAESSGGNESIAITSAETQSENSSWTEGTNKSTSWSPMLMPIMGRELSSITFESVADQLFRFAQYLSGQPDRHCVIKLVSKPPVPALTQTVKAAMTTVEWAADWVTTMVAALPFAVRTDVALARIGERHRLITNKLLESHSEPSTTGILLPVKRPTDGEGKAPVKVMRRV